MASIAMPDCITIRRAAADDGESLIRLAGLDSRRVPLGNFLIAEVEGEAWAAVAIESGEVIADPFHHTADICQLLRLRAARIREAANPASIRKQGFAGMVAATGRLLPGARRRAAAESRPCAEACSSELRSLSIPTSSAVRWNGSAIVAPVLRETAARASPSTSAISRSPSGTLLESRPARRRSAWSSRGPPARIVILFM
jgi:hypothetical protein